MKTRLNFLSIVLLLLCSTTAVCQKVVSADDIVRRQINGVYVYFYREDTIPFTGIAYDYYSNKKQDHEFEIDKGACRIFSHFSESGHLLSRTHYSPAGLMDGSFIQLSDQGDTILYGNFKDDKKDGPWIEMENDQRFSGQYSMDNKTGIWTIRVGTAIVGQERYNEKGELVEKKPIHH